MVYTCVEECGIGSVNAGRKSVSMVTLNLHKTHADHRSLERHHGPRQEPRTPTASPPACSESPLVPLLPLLNPVFYNSCFLVIYRFTFPAPVR